ncbi:MAG TPA: hypothetical protein PKY86_08920, partial [Niabella sp.]|nr:hypothetical protein [Niabella sp.]
MCRNTRERSAEVNKLVTDAIYSAVQECDAIPMPYILKPGSSFFLSQGIVLGSHGLFTWGDTAYESY